MNYYRRAGELVTLANSFTASGAYRLNHRASLSFTEAFVTRADAEQLVEEGLLLPRVRTYTNRSLGTFGYRLSRRSSLSFATEHAWTQFADSTLPGGQALSLATNLSLALRPSRSLSFAYAYETSSSPETFAARGHYWVLGLVIRPQPELELGAAGGLSSISLTGSDDLSARTPTAHLSLARRTRRSSFSAGYDRDTSQAFGFGRQRLSNSIHARWETAFKPRLSASVLGSYGRSRDLFDPDFRFGTLLANANLRFLLRRPLQLSLGYDYRRFDQIDPLTTTTTTSGRLTYGVVYTREWK